MEKNMASIDDVLNLPQRRILMPTRNLIMDQHEQIVNKFFDDFLGNRKNFIHSNTSYPKMDIFEDDIYFYLDFAVPGVEEKYLDIEVVKETKLLTISGSSRFLAQREKKHLYHLKELKQSAFTRTIQLPDDLELEPEVCHLENGILKLAFKKIILKAEEPKETIKKISIKKS
jgi:HSP20 family molecular chaperone IbpA